MDIPSHINLKVGECYTLRLPGKLASGYQWSFNVASNEHAAQLSTKKSPLRAAMADNIPLPGASTDEIVTIQALQPGTTTVHLMLYRPWEAQRPPVQEHNITVNVQQ
jgi:predicted secreted protein